MTVTHQFRNYTNSSRQSRVEETYFLNHKYQTLSFVLQQKQNLSERLSKPNTSLQLTIWEAMAKLDQIVDDSDPDTSNAQTVHAFQTAEAIRKAHPKEDWFHLVGLIHDLGKVLCLLDDPLPQWAVVGDTFPVGCKHDENIVFYKYFKENPDTSNPQLNSRLGIYKEFCGLDNVHFSFGHDEYMYQVCVANKCKIPKQGLAMIRYHSFYAWHRCGGYKYLMNESDYEMLKWVVEFNKFDLYSKKDEIPDVKKLRPYYEQLVKKYFPVEKLKW